ncbi:hypothetical protein ACFE04_023289 [Oxalis oulophora]
MGVSKNIRSTQTTISCIKCNNPIIESKKNLMVRCPKCNYINLNSKNELAKNAQTWAREVRVEFMHKVAGTHYPKGVLTLNNCVLVAARPRKRALLCGVVYRWSKDMVMGPINDVLNMKELLISCFGFVEQSFLILTDAETSAELKPTRKNIERGLQWLVHNCTPGDSLVFYFSGHGMQEVESDGDEVDGYNEAICPLDYKSNGVILDNQINSMIVRPLTQGVTLHAIMDCCNSGTVLDLTSIYDSEKKQWVDEYPPNGCYKGTSGGLAISISACKDYQIANTALIFSGETAAGAMTYALVRAIKKNNRLTYASLLASINDVVQETKKAQARNSNFIGKLFLPKFSQEVQLSSSEKFNIACKEFML